MGIHIKKIDEILKLNNNGKLDGNFRVSKEEACKIIDLIYNTIKIESDNCIDRNSFISLINYLSTEYVNIHCRTNRNMSRLRKTDRYYQDMPYSGQGDLNKAKEMAKTEPTLMLMKQNGYKEQGWMGGEFYWPVLVTHDNVDTAVYTSELLK